MSRFSEKTMWLTRFAVVLGVEPKVLPNWQDMPAGVSLAKVLGGGDDDEAGQTQNQNQTAEERVSESVQ
jgi:hypothetical protein